LNSQGFNARITEEEFSFLPPPFAEHSIKIQNVGSNKPFKVATRIASNNNTVSLCTSVIAAMEVFKTAGKAPIFRTRIAMHTHT
jgi:hypothetical protein